MAAASKPSGSRTHLCGFAVASRELHAAASRKGGKASGTFRFTDADTLRAISAKGGRESRRRAAAKRAATVNGEA